MKRLFLSSVLIMSMFLAVIAQEETTTSGDPLVSKKGFTILPEAGDYAIGVDAAPFVTLLGNMVALNNGGAAYNANFNFLNGKNTIYGKYFTDANTAIRASVRFDVNTTRNKFYVQNDVLAATSSTFDPLVDVVEDKRVTSRKNAIIGLGMEYRRGHNRLQGYYGGEVLLNIGGATRDKYTYGNEITSVYTDPTNAFGFTGARTLTSTTGSTFGLGLRGFVGVEYFIAPKISIGGELGLGLMFTRTGETKTEAEYWDATLGAVDTAEMKTAGNSIFDLDTDNNNLVTSSVFLLFHF